MSFSVEEILLIIGLIGSIFAFCMNKVVVLAKDLSSLNEKYESLEASKFSQDERLTKMEAKVTELDKNVDGIMIHLGSIKSGIGELKSITSKIFDLLDKKQDKVAV